MGKINIYIAKPNTWYDVGTIAIKISENFGGISECALFVGTKNGKKDEEGCGLDEFDIVEVEYCD